MTENEKELLVAIEHLKARNMSAKHIDMAIKSLEKQTMVNELLHECKELENELEQYRAIGTIEEFKELKENQQIRNEAITEFAERLKDKVSSHYVDCDGYFGGVKEDILYADYIDQIAEEMRGEKQ